MKNSKERVRISLRKQNKTKKLKIFSFGKKRKENIFMKTTKVKESFPVDKVKLIFGELRKLFKKIILVMNLIH